MKAMKTNDMPSAWTTTNKPMPESPNLALYYFDECPYCQLVLESIEQLNLKVEMRNTRSSQEHYQTLIKDTGRRTVPCLYIDGKPMHESREIVAWLEKNQGSLTKRP
jgi:glutaredoxin